MKTQKLLRSKLFWGIMLVFLLLWGYSLSSFLKFSDKNYVGSIVSLSSGSLVIEDGKEGNREILYDSQTKIFTPEEVQIEIKVGTPVFIEVLSKGETPLKAKFIRVLPPRK
jgi:hypothetical protein